MRIFKNGSFHRFARKERIHDSALTEAIERAEKGSVDADLGGGVIKQRIARKGAGRSGGYRTIVFFRSGERAFFMHGFAKSSQANIKENELADFKQLATLYLALSDKQISTLIENGALTEVIS